MRSGSHIDLIVASSEDGSAPDVAYLQVFGGKNGICIAAIGVATADGRNLGWIGDMGTAAGKSGAPSSVKIGERMGTRVIVCGWIAITRREIEPLPRCIFTCRLLIGHLMLRLKAMWTS